MANYHITPTGAGAELLTKCMEGGKTLSFTSIQMGDGDAPNSDFSQVAALASVKKTLPVAAIARSGATVTCTAKLDYTEITEDFQWKEVGLIAKDPDTQTDVVFCYGNAGDQGDWITGGVAASAKNINISTIVSTEANVTAVIDNTKTYAMVDLTNVSDANLKTAVERSGALAAYAPLASPALTGTPTAPTADQGDSSTTIATTAFVNAAILRLIGAAPGALDTLEELANALGDDPNFATTVTNLIAEKAPLESPALTGTPTAPTPETGDSSTKIATTEFVSGAVETGSEYATMLDELEYETQLHGYIADRISKGGEIYVATPPAESELPHLGLKDNPFRTLQEAANYLPEDLHGKTAVIYVLSRIKTITAESTTVFSWAAPENAYQSDTVIENVRNGKVWIQYGELEINEAKDTWTVTEAEGDTRGKLGHIVCKHCDNVTLVNFQLGCNYSTEEHAQEGRYPAVTVTESSALYIYRCTVAEGDYAAAVDAGSGFYIAEDCSISNMTGAVMHTQAGARYGLPKPDRMSTLTLSGNAYFSIMEQYARFSSQPYYYFETYYNLDTATGRLTETQTKYYDADGREVDYATGSPVAASSG
ncbi:hypothetical protein [Agathobaculum desmolans]|uniref:hypothetical protein n=1 Tax=Agathobaculum desmolans TaxID=39484 RepID=UPI00248E0F81|nr:hypothetical protein [Agathobaculum desmolans]